MNSVHILLGSNVNKEKNLPAATQLLTRCCRMIAVSSVYETLPMGKPHQPLFFNAAVKIQTNLTVQNLKQNVLDQIELQLHRKKSGAKNFPRTIDLDIILFNKDVFTYGHRLVPDPDLLKFAHVAVPLAEISPNFIHPVSATPLSVIAKTLVEKYQKENSGDLPVHKRTDINLLKKLVNGA